MALDGDQVEYRKPSPKTYEEQNYRIDQVKTRFVDCVTRIINESGLTGDAIDRLARSAGQEVPQEPEQLAEIVRCTYIQAQIEYINVIIENFKNNKTFVSILIDSMPHLNTINNRLQDQDFINSLKSANGNLSNYTLPQLITYQDREYYLMYTLNQCYTGITDNNMYDHNPGSPGHHNSPPTHKITWANHIDKKFINNLVFEFLQFKTTPPHVHTYTISNALQYLMVLLPISAREGSPKIDIDLQYFQRYFQCVLDFLTALLSVNTIYDIDGGKQRKKIKTRKQKPRRLRKSKKRGFKPFNI